jgi:hypothetical protein
MKNLVIVIAVFCCSNCLAETKTDSICTNSCKTKKHIEEESIDSKVKADTLLFKIGPDGNAPYIPEEKQPFRAKAILIKES